MLWDCWLCIYLISQPFLIKWNHSLGVLEHRWCQPRGQRCFICPAIRFESLSTVGTCTILSKSQNTSKLSIFQEGESPGVKSDHNQELLPVFLPLRAQKVFHSPQMALEQTRERFELIPLVQGNSSDKPKGSLASELQQQMVPPSSHTQPSSVMQGQQH